MTCLGIFDEDGDGSQDDGSLFSLAGEFMEAARVLYSTPPTHINYSLVIYYLVGHSAELYLKAFLYRKSASISQLKDVGHNLERLVTMAQERGIPETLSLPHVRQLGAAYKDKDFEYRKHAKKTFPDLDLLIDEVRHLSTVVFDSICP
jgi:hypothetical protein